MEPIIFENWTRLSLTLFPVLPLRDPNFVLKEAKEDQEP